MVQTLLAWAGFAVGFGFRPLGAVVFGYLGDRLGRKYTFLVTIALMGVATAGVGLVPEASQIGYAAPVLVLLLRIAQGLALGGEYGGAAVYVAEHSPPGKSGFYTSFIQAGVVGGFILSLAVVLATKAVLPAEAWAAWGWRVPFLFSIVLLAISLWMRLKLSESPVFKAMRAAGEQRGQPAQGELHLSRQRQADAGRAVRDRGRADGDLVHRDVLRAVVPVGTDAGGGDDRAAARRRAARCWGWGGSSWSGALSDRVGRKRPIVWGYVADAGAAVPAVLGDGRGGESGAGAGGGARAGGRLGAGIAPTARSPRCRRTRAASCSISLSKKGVAYHDACDAGDGADDRRRADRGHRPGGRRRGADRGGLRPGAGPAAGREHRADPARASWASTALSGLTYGPVAALLSEMFPPAIRYSSLSIPYHLGTGYFGGFLPFISQYIVAKTGDPYAGLWYTWGVTLMALVVTAFGLRERPRRQARAHDRGAAADAGGGRCRASRRRSRRARSGWRCRTSPMPCARPTRRRASRSLDAALALLAAADALPRRGPVHARVDADGWRTWWPTRRRARRRSTNAIA